MTFTWKIKFPVKRHTAERMKLDKEYGANYAFLGQFPAG